MSAMNLSNPVTVRYLTSNYLDKSNPQMAEELSVTVGAITGMLQRLKLRRPSRQLKVVIEPDEQWKLCKRHPGFQVSSLGRVINGDVLLVQTINGRGYYQVKMYSVSGERKSERVHRLVAEEFLLNAEEKLEVNHIDGNKANNVAANLEWVTGKENVRHAVANNLVKRRSGVAHHYCKHGEDTIRTVCQLIANGVSSPEIERQLSLPQGYVSGIRNKRSWKVISDEYFSS